MWKRLGQQDDPAWRRSGPKVQQGSPSVAGPLLRFPEALAAPLSALARPPQREAPQSDALSWDIPASVLDEEIRQLIAAADDLLAQHMPTATPESLQALSAALAAVLRERLVRLGSSERDTAAYEELLQRRLIRMSMDLGASEAEVAELKQKLAQFLAMGDWPLHVPAVEGLSPESGNYQKKLALLSRIVEENIALRSRPSSDLDA
jgi:hypothetical protein